MSEIASRVKAIIVDKLGVEESDGAERFVQAKFR
jgi:acyl carrier protein